MTSRCHGLILPHAPLRDNVRFLAHDVIRDTGQEGRQQPRWNHRRKLTASHGPGRGGLQTGQLRLPAPGIADPQDEGSTTVTTQMTTRHPARAGHRTARGLPVVAGVGYSLAWIISVSVGAPNPAVAARGSQVVAAFAGHGGPAIAVFVLAKGVAAAALAVVVISAARTACRSGATGLPGRTGAGFWDRRRGGVLDRAFLGSLAGVRPRQLPCEPPLPGPPTRCSPGLTGRRCSCWPRWPWPCRPWP